MINDHTGKVAVVSLGKAFHGIAFGFERFDWYRGGRSTRRPKRALCCLMIDYLDK